MRYYVVMPDGQKYGPADVDMLTQWANEGRLTPGTTVEVDGSGQRLSAQQVPGILWPNYGGPQMQQPMQPPPTPFAPPTSGPQNPYSPGYQQAPNQYNPYSQAPSPYTRPGAIPGDDGSKELRNAYVFSVLGLLCCPLVFGGLGIWQASVAKQKGHPQAQSALTVAIVLTVIGFAIGIGFNTLSHFIR
ncbi:MAG: hypothetical protein JST40_02500 [Armatimonadetes bacterium]|nr:hypothetical protein [Armatimonadota bacterium]